MYSDMSSRTRLSSLSKGLGKGLGELGLAHSRGAEEDEGTYGPLDP